MPVLYKGILVFCTVIVVYSGRHTGKHFPQNQEFVRMVLQEKGFVAEKPQKFCKRLTKSYFSAI